MYTLIQLFPFPARTPSFPVQSGCRMLVRVCLSFCIICTFYPPPPLPLSESISTLCLCFPVLLSVNIRALSASPEVSSVRHLVLHHASQKLHHAPGPPSPPPAPLSMTYRPPPPAAPAPLASSCTHSPCWCLQQQLAPCPPTAATSCCLPQRI